MPETPDFSWLFIKMIAGLVLVIGLVIVVVRFVLPRLRLGISRRPAWGEIIDRMPIEPRRNLYVIKLAGRYFVIGTSEHSTHLIAELTQAEGEKIEAS